MKDKYRHIFEPLVVGNHVIKNRIIMGSMHTGLEEGGQEDFSRMGTYFAERASTGIGLIITGGISPNEEGALDGLFLIKKAKFQGIRLLQMRFTMRVLTRKFVCRFYIQVHWQ